MNTLPRLLPSLPFCYQDGSFQVILRNAESAAVFWDLLEQPSQSKLDLRLCLHIVAIDVAGGVSAKASQVLILHHETGHAFVPLEPLEPLVAGCASYRFTLGWDDGTEFREIAVDELQMPVLAEAVSRPAKEPAVEGRGFHPLAMAVAT